MNLPEPRRYFFGMALLLFLSGAGFTSVAQCGNSISLKKAAVPSNADQGTIEVEVRTSGEYICTLSIEKGSGPEKVQEKRGRGDGIVSFTGVDRNYLYKVHFEFLNEDKPFCNKLEKSGITLEAR